MRSKGCGGASRTRSWVRQSRSESSVCSLSRVVVAADLRGPNRPRSWSCPVSVTTTRPLGQSRPLDERRTGTGSCGIGTAETRIRCVPDIQSLSGAALTRRGSGLQAAILTKPTPNRERQDTVRILLAGVRVIGGEAMAMLGTERRESGIPSSRSPIDADRVPARDPRRC